jgi:hypothetical protein
MRVRITRHVSLSLLPIAGYLLPITLVLLACAFFLPTRMLLIALPVVFVANGMWWAHVWHHKLRSRNGQ